jgi:anti-sigma factor RsiW
MNCEWVQDQLSSFIDHEVGPEERLRIEQHLEGCESCRAEVSQLMAVGNLMRQSELIVDTQAVWERVASQLDGQPITIVRNNANSPKWIYAILATAASVILVWVAFSVSHTDNTSDHAHVHSEHQHASMAVDFQDVFRSAQKEPKAAIARLVAKYQGQELNEAATTAYLGYEPALFKTLPVGFTRVSTHVLNMPCCKCSATICERNDGTSMVVFEHKEEQPMWFGDASSIDTQCAGKSCKIIESEGKLAVSWKSKDRQLTMIGANDLSEVSEWVEAMNL